MSYIADTTPCSTDQSSSDSMVCTAYSQSCTDSIQSKNSLGNFPTFSWALLTDRNTEDPILKEVKTISRPLIPLAKQDRKVCPYGDQPALLAVVEACSKSILNRSAYTLSALRFKLNPFPDKDSRLDNKAQGIPTVLRPLYSHKLSCQKQNDNAWLQFPTLRALETYIERIQREMRSLYTQELVPLMNDNPLDPTLHSQGLSSPLIHDLEQYVKLQNTPLLFLELMQWLERDIAKRRWRSAHAGNPITSEGALTFVMNSWTDKGETRRKRAIVCPTGVPLGYMQSLRRKNQPFITNEFANHAHGAYNHWLQEHVWQRFYARYPESCQLSPRQFFKQLGKAHFAFSDAIYELHMENVANPANTNFWSVLQFYLPFMSPWP